MAWPRATGTTGSAGSWIVRDSGPGRFSSAAQCCAGACLAGREEQHERDERQAHRFERGTDGPKVAVIGVHGSDSSMRAAAYAAGLARRRGALLAVVYVQPSLTTGAVLRAPVAETPHESAEHLVQQIREAAERVKGIGEIRREFPTLRGAPTTA